MKQRIHLSVCLFLMLCTAAAQQSEWPFVQGEQFSFMHAIGSNTPCDPPVGFLPGTAVYTDYLYGLACFHGRLICIRTTFLPDDYAGHLPGFSRMEDTDAGEAESRTGALYHDLAHTGEVAFERNGSDRSIQAVMQYSAPELRLSNLRIEDTRSEVVKKLKMDQWDFSGLLRDMVIPAYVGW